MVSRNNGISAWTGNPHFQTGVRSALPVSLSGIHHAVSVAVLGVVGGSVSVGVDRLPGRIHSHIVVADIDNRICFLGLQPFTRLVVTV